MAGTNGNIIPDIYYFYFGNAGTNYGGIRTSPVDNVTMSVVELL